MPVAKRVTKSDILLLAASKLPELFTAEDLTVAAWGINQKMFGIEGFEDKYPNNNRVLCCLMGEKGLVKKGKLKRIGNSKDRKYKLVK